MRPLVCLAFLLTALALPHASQGSDRELDSLQRELASELQRRIDDGLGAELAAALRERAPAPRDAAAVVRARVDAAAPALRVATGAPAAPDSASARPARMRCRIAHGYDLDCVVVSTRPGTERVARSR